jgi:hypothetical protein
MKIRQEGADLFHADGQADTPKLMILDGLIHDGVELVIDCGCVRFSDPRENRLLGCLFD